VAAVGAWPVFWAPYGRHGGVAGRLEPYGRRGGVANPLCLFRVRGGVAGPLGPVWMPRGRGRSTGSRMAAVGVWPVFTASYGCHGGVAIPLSPVWPSWGRGRSLGICMSAVVAWLFP